MRLSFSKIFAYVVLGVLTVFLSPLFVVVFVADLAWGALLFCWWQICHGSNGRRWLAVYSDSAKWREHFENVVLPLVGSEVVAVNISKVPTWRMSRSLERQVHRHWGGREEHTPILIRFPWPVGRVTATRFYGAYLANAKTGASEELEQRLARVQELVNES